VGAPLGPEGEPQDGAGERQAVRVAVVKSVVQRTGMSLASGAVPQSGQSGSGVPTMSPPIAVPWPAPFEEKAMRASDAAG
jgi:hypothetical protein